jgi:hypothetical protein
MTAPPKELTSIDNGINGQMRILIANRANIKTSLSFFLHTGIAPERAG